MASIGIVQLQEVLNDCDTAMQIIDEVVYGDGKLNDGEYVDLCSKNQYITTMYFLLKYE